MLEHIAAPLHEVKFSEAEGPGTFEGLGSVFGVVDSHGDAVVPGAFKQTLAEHKARGTLPIMWAMHGPALGADPLPAGKYTHMEETAEGLHVKGRISALDTDYGKRIRALVEDGALAALSIGFHVRAGGATHHTKARPGEPRRTLKAVDLLEVSLVPNGSNPAAKVTGIKSDLVEAIGAEGLRALLEVRARVGTDNPPTERELEKAMRDALGLSRSDAADLIAGRGWKSLRMRDAAAGEASKAAIEAARTMRAALDGISFPTF